MESEDLFFKSSPSYPHQNEKYDDKARVLCFVCVVMGEGLSFVWLKNEGAYQKVLKNPILERLTPIP